MDRKKVTRALGAVFSLAQLVNFIYVMDFRNEIVNNSLTISGKTVVYLPADSWENFFLFETVVTFVSLFVVAAIVDLATKQ